MQSEIAGLNKVTFCASLRQLYDDLVDEAEDIAEENPDGTEEED